MSSLREAADARFGLVASAARSKLRTRRIFDLFEIGEEAAALFESPEQFGFAWPRCVVALVAAPTRTSATTRRVKDGPADRPVCWRYA